MNILMILLIALIVGAITYARHQGRDRRYDDW